jgi:hypothetical protein
MQQRWALRRAAAAIRVAAWASIVALALLSLVPSGHVARTGLGGRVEHLLAYACAAIAVGVARSELGALRILVALVTYAGVLEFLQRFSPGRTSSFQDFAYSASGVLLGVAIVVLFKRMLSWIVPAVDNPAFRMGGLTKGTPRKGHQNDRGTTLPSS